MYMCYILYYDLWWTILFANLFFYATLATRELQCIVQLNKKVLQDTKLLPEHIDNNCTKLATGRAVSGVFGLSSQFYFRNAINRVNNNLIYLFFIKWDTNNKLIIVLYVGS